MHNQLVAQAIGLPSADDIVKVQEARLKRAVIYLRVSTPRQARKNGEPEGYSLPAQREYCTRHAHELGATVVEEFVDAGESARTADRPNLQRLLTYIEENQVGYVIVHKLDRLARSMADLMVMIQTLDHKAVGLRVLNLGMDTHTPTGKLMLTMIGAIATFEREIMLERQAEGIALAKAKGVYKGRKPTAMEKRDEVLHLLSQGIAKASVAKRLGISVSSVHRITCMSL